MTSQAKIIAVVGATGAQGGGLVRAIHSDPDAAFRVRALTRDTHSDKAVALSEVGADLVRADLDDLESLKVALRGAYGAYCVTNFWESFSPVKETAQAAHLAEAARGAGLRHVIWSTLEDTRKWVPLNDERMPALMENYKVPHFDAKGEANKEFNDRGIPTTFLLTSFYWDNLISLEMLSTRDADGMLLLTLPMGDKPLPGIASEDIGKCAYGIFQHGADYIGKTVGIAGQHLTGGQMAAALGKALGQEVRYNAVLPAAYRAFGFPGAEDVGNMYQFKHDFNDDYCAVRDVDEARALNPELLSFDAWLAKYKDRIPVARP